MQFIHRNITNKSQWQIYKELELIPDSVTYSQANNMTFAFGLDRVWRLLIIALTQELVEEQQVEYLERCLAVNNFDVDSHKGSKTLQKLWTLMN